MTRAELEAVLQGMRDDEFRKLTVKLCSQASTPEDYVYEFINSDQQFERRLCHYLKLETEDEKMVRSAMESAKASQVSAMASERSAEVAAGVARYARWAAIGALISALAAVVTVGLMWKALPSNSERAARGASQPAQQSPTTFTK